MMKSRILFCLILFSSNFLFAQKEYNYKDKYLIVDIDNRGNQFIDYNICKTNDSLGKEIYILNALYKIKKHQRSWIGSESDFMFSFYIISPDNRPTLEEIKNSDHIITHDVKDLLNLSENLSRAWYTDLFDFTPILKINHKYYKFSNCSIQGQAFNVLEDSQYFPKYGSGSDKYELNLLVKPYKRPEIDSLRRIISKDSTAMVDFAVGVEDFYDKWFINKVDKQNKTIDFWAEFKTVATGKYSFGRITTAITYKVNKGVIGFKIWPIRPEFNEKYFDSDYSSVDFKFSEFIDLKSFLPVK